MAGNVMEFQQYSEAFRLGLSKVYKNTLKMHPRTYSAFLKEAPVEEWYVKEWEVSGFGTMPEKGIGAEITTDRLIKSATKEYSLKAYALGVVFDYEFFRWDLYGVSKDLAPELAKSAMDRYNITGYSLLNNSFSAPDASYQLYSGENMISTSHTRLDGGTWSNQVPGNPGLSYLALQQAKILLKKIVNQRGLYVRMEPRLLITSADQEWMAEELTMSSSRPDQSNPTVYNSVRRFSTHASPYLTTPQYWWIQTNKEDCKFGVHLGDKPQLRRDSDVRTLALVLTSYCSFNVWLWDSRGLVGSTGGA